MLKFVGKFVHFVSYYLNDLVSLSALGLHFFQAVEAARANGLSLALFAQGWTYQCLPKKDFTTNNNK